MKLLFHLLRALLCCGLLVLAHGAEPRPGRPADQADRADRPGAATDVMARLLGDGVGRAPRSADGGREHAGRLGHPGASGGRARGAGRPHAAVHQHVGHGDQSGVVQAASLRSDARLHAGRDGLQPRAADAVGQRRAAGRRRCPSSIAYAKANRGKLSIAFDTTAGAAAFAAKLLNRRADLGLVEVPYRSAGQMTQDVAGGVNQVMMSSIAAANCGRAGREGAPHRDHIQDSGSPDCPTCRR